MRPSAITPAKPKNEVSRHRCRAEATAIGMPELQANGRRCAANAAA